MPGVFYPVSNKDDDDDDDDNDNDDDEFIKFPPSRAEKRRQIPGVCPKDVEASI